MTATPASHPFEIRAHRGRMAIAALEDRAVGRLFGLAGAHELLEIHESRGAALEALAPRPS
jgi:hypothetical protein